MIPEVKVSFALFSVPVQTNVPKSVCVYEKRELKEAFMNLTLSFSHIFGRRNYLF